MVAILLNDQAESPGKLAQVNALHISSGVLRQASELCQIKNIKWLPLRIVPCLIVHLRGPPVRMRRVFDPELVQYDD